MSDEINKFKGMMLPIPLFVVEKDLRKNISINLGDIAFSSF